ncbi:hypothetical protein [Micromonospora sp. CB01531]|uniref:hypothetical protein n=1 Tax=Micromonospora sp. CB01531 TaxID=1718947 RepID=UPI000ADE2D7E|nr:hypothetical protein [Micromonospora sp. CB01531]
MWTRRPGWWGHHLLLDAGFRDVTVEAHTGAFTERGGRLFVAFPMFVAAARRA